MAMGTEPVNQFAENHDLPLTESHACVIRNAFTRIIPIYGTEKIPHLHAGE